MNIPIPQWLVNAWTAFGDWGNVWVWKQGKLEVVRIDILATIAFLFCVGFYWAAYGWLGALKGGIGFIIIAALALFVWRNPDARE